MADDVVVDRQDHALLAWVLDELDIDILDEQRQRLVNQFARVRQKAEQRGLDKLSDDLPALRTVEKALGLAIKTLARRHERLRALLVDKDGEQSHG